jgi:antitoxin ChpS
MKVEVKIQQWGNSASIRLSSAVLAEMHVAIGDRLELDVSTAGMIAKPVKQTKPRYTLEDLMRQCDFSAPESPELLAWNAMPPVGREL